MYESFFGLSGKPFQLNPDPDFFYGSRGHKRAMAYLEYGLHQGEGFIVITGEVGAGKTTLLRNLLRRLPADTYVPVQIVSTQLDADDTLRLVAGSFGLQDTQLAKADLLLRLEAHLQEIHHDGKRALVIIDEAQNLTPRAVEELRMLSNFQVGTKSLMQSFLVGQPEFRDMMQRPEMRQLKQRVIASYHLGPLDPTETQKYIEHRLQHVGWKGDPRFDDGAFQRIHGFTHGVPRRINTLCDRLLLASFLAERHAIGEADVDEAAREIIDELGDGAARRAAVAAGAADEGGAAGRGASRSAGGGGTPGGLDTGELEDELAALLTTVGGGDRPSAERIARLEERVATLEKSNAMLVDSLRKVLAMMREQRAASRELS